MENETSQCSPFATHVSGTGRCDVSEFRDRGYLRLPGFVSESQVVAMRSEIEQATADDPDDNPLSRGGMRFVSNAYRSCVELQRFVCSPEVVGMVTALGGPDLWLRWDQAVWKTLGAPEFPWHQDNGYTGLEAEHIQFWVALTTMDERSGGLLVCPGHHGRVLEHHAVGGHMRADPPGPATAIAADPGDVVIFSSFLPHATTAHRSEDPRLAYVAEFLPLSAPDPSVPGPHLVVSRGGSPRLEWVDLHTTWRI